MELVLRARPPKTNMNFRRSVVEASKPFPSNNQLSQSSTIIELEGKTGMWR